MILGTKQLKFPNHTYIGLFYSLFFKCQLSLFEICIVVMYPLLKDLHLLPPLLNQPVWVLFRGKPKINMVSPWGLNHGSINIPLNKIKVEGKVMLSDVLTFLGHKGYNASRYIFQHTAQFRFNVSQISETSCPVHI